MGQLTIVYWRDIPSQVIAKAGRANEKRMLPDRFQQAIDMAAMRDGASGTEDYLADWRRAEPVACGDDLAQEADRAAADLDARFDKERLRALIANGGREPA
jgi:Virulence factor